MRIWDQIEPAKLCRRHLLGEHRELHGLWSILKRNREGGEPGYLMHPETRRWNGNERALWRRHQRLVKEMERRGYQHRSPLDKLAMDGSGRTPKPLDDQVQALRKKKCECDV